MIEQEDLGMKERRVGEECWFVYGVVIIVLALVLGSLIGLPFVYMQQREEKTPRF